MLQINPKKFKHIQNKTIPSPLRPKFRNSNETNIYFLSKKKFLGEKKELTIRKIKINFFIIIFCASGYFLTN